MNTTVCDVCDKRIGKNGRYSYYVWGAKTICGKCFDKGLSKDKSLIVRIKKWFNELIRNEC